MSMYSIWCLIERDKTTFKVMIPVNGDIADLRELIKEKGKNSVLSSVLAKDLTLWKIDVNDRDPAIKKRIRARQYQPELPLNPLHARDSISDIWSGPPPNHCLHIFVELPRTGDTDTQPVPSSSQSSKLWDQGWIQLRDNEPWKLFGDYWRKQDVETLRTRSSITLAPATSNLPLSPQTNNKVIVRECYKSLYDYILMRRDDSNGLVLNGQPGTGKTLWLSYALVRLLAEKETVAFHSSNRTILFLGNSVYSPNPNVETTFPPAEPVTFCLIDSDGVKDPVNILFMTDAPYANRTFPIMASSPMPSRYDTWQKQRMSVRMELMPLWERDELKKGFEMHPHYNRLRQDVETALHYSFVDDSSAIPISEERRNVVLSAVEMIRNRDDATDDASGDDAMDDAGDYPTGNAMNYATGDVSTEDVDEVLDQILDNAIEAYGSSARDVYQAIFSPTVIETSITCALRGQKYNALREAAMLLERIESNSLSHKIFSMRVTRPIGQAHLPNTSPGFEVQFKSHRIQTEALKHLEFLEHLDIALMINEMRSLTHSSSLAGFLYQAYAAKELAFEESPPELVPMTAAAGTTTFFVTSGSVTIASPFGRSRVRSYASFSTAPLAVNFEVDPNKSLADYFWIPLGANNPLFNAFIIEFNERFNAVVWILQMTLSQTHGGSAQGYQLIKLIKEKVEEAMEEAMETNSRTKQRKQNFVKVKYVLVSPKAGRWMLPEKNWPSCKGPVYYQYVKTKVVCDCLS